MASLSRTVRHPIANIRVEGRSGRVTRHPSFPRLPSDAGICSRADAIIYDGRPDAITRLPLAVVRDIGMVRGNIPLGRLDRKPIVDRLTRERKFAEAIDRAGFFDNWAPGRDGVLIRTFPITVAEVIEVAGEMRDGKGDASWGDYFGEAGVEDFMLNEPGSSSQIPALTRNSGIILEVIENINEYRIGVALPTLVQLEENMALCYGLPNRASGFTAYELVRGPDGIFAIVKISIRSHDIDKDVSRAELASRPLGESKSERIWHVEIFRSYSNAKELSTVRPSEQALMAFRLVRCPIVALE